MKNGMKLNVNLVISKYGGYLENLLVRISDFIGSQYINIPLRYFLEWEFRFRSDSNHEHWYKYDDVGGYF